MDFTGKVVLITGASSGIGAATAIQFAQMGANLILVGRSSERLQATATKCLHSDDHLQLQIDLNDEKAVESILQKTLDRFHKIDVLINAAGIIENGSIESTSLEQYDRLMQTNIRSIYQLTALVVPELKKTKGSIVNVSSVCGMRSFPNILAYSLSKAALDQFTECVALELAHAGVRCNAVNPGVVVTELHKRGGMDEEKYTKFLEHCKSTHALGRVGQVDEVANVICFLASDCASFITGSKVPVDGGRHAMCPR